MRNLSRSASNFAAGLLVAFGSLATVTAMSVGLSGCAHVQPVIHDVVTCGGQTVDAADVTEAYTDLTTQNWVDLTSEAVRLGWDEIACVIDDLSAAHPELKARGEKFKADHAEQIRQAEGPSASLDSTKTRGARLALPGAGGTTVATAIVGAREAIVTTVAPVAPRFAYAGETVWSAEHRCELACGSRDAIGSPGGDCICWRGPHDRRGGWVAGR